MLNLSMEERERLAYIRGDTDAVLLGQLIDANDCLESDDNALSECETRAEGLDKDLDAALDAADRLKDKLSETEEENAALRAKFERAKIDLKA